MNMHVRLNQGQSGPTWPEERIARLKALWGDGASCSQIAKELGGGLTRSAVIGKVHRLGLSGRPRIARPKKVSAPHLEARLRRRRKNGHHVAPDFDKAFVVEPVIENVSDQEIPVAQRRSLMQLGNEHCRWPVGDPLAPDFFFCGASEADLTGGRPYCPSHTHRSTNNPVNIGKEANRAVAKQRVRGLKAA